MDNRYGDHYRLRSFVLRAAALTKHPQPPMITRHPSGFIEPCLPSKETRPPSGPL
jgi:hypothetical protein